MQRSKYLRLVVYGKDTAILSQEMGENIMTEFTLEELKKSENKIGQIFPVIKDQHGNILDGFHRKRINPDWKETIVNVTDELQALQIRVHSNLLRRKVDEKEKQEWVKEARRILRNKNGIEPTQKEIADSVIMSQQWVSLYDTLPNVNQDIVNIPKKTNRDFYGYNVWGFQNEDWRKQIQKGEPEQPDKEFYHGSTPAFVIENLLKMYSPKSVLDSMAGVGTTGFVCSKYGIESEQFDLYPFEKWNVKEGDAEFIEPNRKYDLIFNHIPYLNMVHYGHHEQDLSAMNEKTFFEKLKRIILKNRSLLNDNGIYAILVGDWRFSGKLIPITAKITLLVLDCGFALQDEAVKLTAEQKSTGIQEYRATKSGYLAQTFDMVLMFKKE